MSANDNLSKELFQGEKAPNLQEAINSYIQEAERYARTTREGLEGLEQSVKKYYS